MTRSLINFDLKKIKILLTKKHSFKFLINKFKNKQKSSLNSRIAFFNFFSLFKFEKNKKNLFFNYHKALTNSILINLKQKYIGISQGFSIELLAIGVGYRFERLAKKINVLVLNLGYSHYNYVLLSNLISFRFHKNYLFLFGLNFLELKLTALQIKSNRIPEPYKGKGIRYFSEIIEIKEGKKKKS